MSELVRRFDDQCFGKRPNKFPLWVGCNRRFDLSVEPTFAVSTTLVRIACFRSKSLQPCRRRIEIDPDIAGSKMKSIKYLSV